MSKISDFSDEFINKLKAQGKGLYEQFIAELNQLPKFKPINQAKKASLKPSIIEDKKIISKLKRKSTTILNKTKKLDEEVKNIKSAYDADNDTSVYHDVYYDGIVLFFVDHEERAGDKKNKSHGCVGQDGQRYDHIKTIYAHVQGNLSPFNNKRTYKKPYTGERQKTWDKLHSILKTDRDIKNFFSNASREITLIIIKNASESKEETKEYQPLDDYLFNDNDNSKIYNKFIHYNLNKQASTFSEMFNIELNKYTQDNYKANSCYFNIIVDTYHDEFEKVKKDGKRFFKPLTYESLCELIDIKFQNQDLGLSIRQSVKFFEKYHLSLIVVNVYGHILFSYRPEKRNQVITPQTLSILEHNNHCYKLDTNLSYKLRNLREKNGDLEEWDEIEQLQVSNKYHIRKESKNEKVYMINNINECVKYINDYDDDESEEEEKEEFKYIKFITNRDLTEFLFDMINQKYTPNIVFSGGRVLSLSFFVSGIHASIENVDSTAPEDTMIQIDSVEYYKKYHEIDDKFYNKIMKESLMSDYNDNVLDIEEKYQIVPLSGYTTDKFINKEFNAVDMVKAYTDCLQNINNVPIFGYFDEYLNYDGHDIEDYNMYCVEVISNNIKTNILFPNIYSRCYGFLLKKATEQNINYKIHLYRKPCNIENVNYKKAVKDLYDNKDIETIHKKYIVNKTTGLLEKKYNISHLVKIFDTRAEAQYYQLKYGGRIHTLTETLIKKIKQLSNPLDYGLETIDDLNDVTTYEYGKKIFVLIFEKKERLIEGFRQIKEIIYNMMSIKLYDLYKTAEQNNIKVYGFKTDSILINKSKNDIEHIFKFDDSKIGGLRFETNKSCVDVKIKQQQNEPFNKIKNNLNEIEIKNEYDTNEINNIFDNNNHILIKGSFPGVGKSTAVQNYEGHEILFITPFNKLAQQLRKKNFKAITLNMLLGFFGEGKEYTNFKSYDITDYEVVCFDELMLYSPKLLKKIDRFMKSNPDKKYISTGDLDQLQPFDYSCNNISNMSDYLKQCIKKLFPNQFTLKINKRLKNEEQRTKLKQLKKEIFETKDIITTLKKYGFKTISKMSEVKTKQNVCYFNFRVDSVNKYIHKTIKHPNDSFEHNGIKYYKGLDIVCKKHYKNKNVRLYVNYTYKIESIGEKFFIIHDEIENQKFTLDIKLLDIFKLPYAGTCHSVQGLSIDEGITIFDVNTPHVDKYYIWTALTRSTDLNNVYIFVHSNDELQALNKSKIKLYWINKIENYKKQDKNANRIFNDDEFIDAEFVKELYAKCEMKCCSCCKTPYETFNDNGMIKTNMSIDRIDNDLPHIKSNCRLLCIDCNKTRSNHY